MSAVILLISSLFYLGVVSMRSASQTMLSSQISAEKKIALIISDDDSRSRDWCNVKVLKNTTVVSNCSDVADALIFSTTWTADKFFFMNVNNSNQYIASEDSCLITRNMTEIKCSTNWRKCCPEDHLVAGPNFNSCVPTTHATAPYRLKINKKMSSFSVLNTSPEGLLECPKGHSKKVFFNTLCAVQSQTAFETSNVIKYQTSMHQIALRVPQWKSLSFEDLRYYCLDRVATPESSNCYDDNVNMNESLQGYTNRSSLCGYNATNNGESNGDSEQRTEILWACVPSDPEPSSSNLALKTTLLAFLWLLAIPLLMSAALANCFIIQTNVHGLILSCYLVSMSVLNVFSAIKFVDVGNKRENAAAEECHPMDFAMKFMYLSTLCWMSSINFGLHKTFRYTLPKPVGTRRLVASVIFSLGFPAISVTTAYYYAANVHRDCNNLDYCALFSLHTIPFYSVPLYTLVLVNFAIFLKTIYVITALKKETGDILRRQRDLMKSFSLFGKLFFIAGCTWILRPVIFVLQVHGEYFTWFGVLLEIIYAIPDIVSPLIVFHHPEFIKWCWSKAPRVSGFIHRFNPYFNGQPMQQRYSA